jgi:hypothetical protein
MRARAKQPAVHVASRHYTAIYEWSARVLSV